MNKGRSHAAGVVLAPRFQMFPWTRVQVRGGDGWGDSRGSDGPRGGHSQGRHDLLSRESQGKTAVL